MQTPPFSSYRKQELKKRNYKKSNIRILPWLAQAYFCIPYSLFLIVHTVLVFLPAYVPFLSNALPISMNQFYWNKRHLSQLFDVCLCQFTIFNNKNSTTFTKTADFISAEYCSTFLSASLQADSYNSRSFSHITRAFSSFLRSFSTSDSSIFKATTCS